MITDLIDPLADNVVTHLGTSAGTAIKAYRQDVHRALFDADLDGLQRGAGLAYAIDRLIISLSDGASTARPPVAIFATGGYGRGQLAPFSDVDLLVITKEKISTSVVHDLFYPLWDGDIPLSQATHTVDSAIGACTDMVTRTALLDARLLWGDPELADAFWARYSALRATSYDAFHEAKRAEQRNRHRTDEFAVNAIEPNVKEGKGALRDLETLHWLDRYRSHDAATPGEYGAPQALAVAQQRRFLRLKSFLWSVRTHLHDVSGQKEDQLTFEWQPQVAIRMGYRDRGGDKAVERFMRHYFLHTQAVIRLDRLTRSVFAAPEEHAPESSPSSTDGVHRHQSSAGVIIDARYGIALRDGGLGFSDESAVSSGVEPLFAMALAYGRTGHPLSEAAFRTLCRGAREVATFNDPGDPVHTLFTRILRESQDHEAVLRMMTEAGLLGRYLPGFGAIIGRMEYGLFRQFTVDEHILRSVGVFSDMYHDRDDGRFKLTKPMVKALDDPAPVLLGLLLSETAVGLANPTKTDLTERVVQQAFPVLKDRAAALNVARAVVQKDILLRAAARRDVTDERLAQRLSVEIPTLRTLQDIAITTTCRHRTMGLKSWEDYARREVRLLVGAMTAYLSGGIAAHRAFFGERAAQQRDIVRTRLGPETNLAFEALVDGTGTAFWSLVDSVAAGDLAELKHEVDNGPMKGAARLEDKPNGLLQIIVYAEDRVGLFAEAARLVTSAGGSVFTASAFAVDDPALSHPYAALVFTIQRATIPPSPFAPTAEERQSLEAQFTALAQGKPQTSKLPSRRLGDRRRVFDVPPIIRFVREVSDDALIVEVEARDRPGLLAKLAKGLAQIGVKIQFAFVSTYGHRAVDTFYLQDPPGYKIEDARRQEVIRRHMLRVLSESEE